MHLPLTFIISWYPPFPLWGGISELFEITIPCLYLRIKQRMSQSSVKAVTSMGESQWVMQAVKTGTLALIVEVHVKGMISVSPGLYCFCYLPFVAKIPICPSSSPPPQSDFSGLPEMISLSGLSPNFDPNKKLNSQLSGCTFLLSWQSYQYGNVNPRPKWL